MPGIAPPVEQAVLRTLLYADIFDFPLTPAEVHHYLIECRTSLQAVESTLEALAAAGRVERVNGYAAIAGRRDLFEIRHLREERSSALWSHARAWGARLAALPFVRMVGVTGALAVNNVAQRPDIDFLLITAPGRLWLCRAAVVALVRAASLRGVLLCPNYLVSTRRLRFDEQNLFTAHDLAQMVPLYGRRVYQALLEQNPWWERYLPQARGPLVRPPAHVLPAHLQFAKRRLERVLDTRVGAALESWEYGRKVRKLSGQATMAATGDGLTFDRDVCKGHFEGHGQRTLAAYRARLQSHGLDGGSRQVPDSPLAAKSGANAAE